MPETLTVQEQEFENFLDRNSQRLTPEEQDFERFLDENSTRLTAQVSQPIQLNRPPNALDPTGFTNLDRQTGGTNIPRQVGASVADFGQSIGNFASRAGTRANALRDIQGMGTSVESLSLPQNLTPEQSAGIDQTVNSNALDVGTVFPQFVQEMQAEQPTTGPQRFARRFGADLVVGGGVGGLATRGLPAAARSLEQTSNILAAGGAAAGEAINPDNVLAPVVGSIAGAASPFVAAGAVRGALRGVGTNAERFADNVNVFNQVGTVPTPGQATESTTRGFLSRTIEGGLEQLPLSRPMFIRRFNDQNEQISQFLDLSLDRISKQRSPGLSGSQIVNAIKREGVDVKGSIANRTVENKFAVLEELVPTSSEGSLKSSLDFISSSTNPVRGFQGTSDLIKGKTRVFLNDLSEQIMADTGGTGLASYDQIKSIRSEIGNRLGRNSLVEDVDEKTLRGMYGALTEDMRTIVANAGDPKALGAFEEANQTYADFKRIEKDYLNGILNKGAEPDKVFTLATNSKTPEAVKEVFKRLTRDERATVTASFTDLLGRANPSRQDDISSVFSSETFLTNWNKIHPDVKQALYPHSTHNGFANDMNAVAKVASRIRTSSQAGKNFSQTAQALLSGTAVIGAFLTGQVGALTTGLGGTAGMSALLTSPKFVNWMAKSTKVPLEALPGYMARLTTEVAQGMDTQQLEALKVFTEDVNSIVLEQ